MQTSINNEPHQSTSVSAFETPSNPAQTQIANQLLNASNGDNTLISILSRCAPVADCFFAHLNHSDAVSMSETCRAAAIIYEDLSDSHEKKFLSLLAGHSNGIGSNVTGLLRFLKSKDVDLHIELSRLRVETTESLIGHSNLSTEIKFGFRPNFYRKNEPDIYPYVFCNLTFKLNEFCSTRGSKIKLEIGSNSHSLMHYPRLSTTSYYARNQFTPLTLTATLSQLGELFNSISGTEKHVYALAAVRLVKNLVETADKSYVEGFEQAAEQVALEYPDLFGCGRAWDRAFTGQELDPESPIS
jgi:hypothetical protein